VEQAPLQPLKINSSVPEEARQLTADNILTLLDASEDDWSGRCWHANHSAIAEENIRFSLTPEMCDEITDALTFIHQNNLTLNHLTQEDFRIPSLARCMTKMREQLDRGAGFLILETNLSAQLNESDFELVGWALCNYFGQIMRQGINSDLRLFTVADKGSQNIDPTRIGASANRSAKHTDNGCLEPRPPAYIGLYCYRSSPHGGETTIVSALSVLREISRQRPELLPQYFQPYHFRAPQAHVWPTSAPTIQKPIFEFIDNELHVHYANVMVFPGMSLAGHALSPSQVDALTLLDEVIERPSLNFQTLLKPGDLLVMNNLALLHGREAFDPGQVSGRTLKRYWMWRRHIGPGTDPVLLDLAEFGY